MMEEREEEKQRNRAFSFANFLNDRLPGSLAMRRTKAGRARDTPSEHSSRV